MNADEKDLLNRHLNGDLDASEQAAFFARLQESAELRRELASLAYDETLISELVLEKRAAAPARRRSWAPAAIAAAMLIGLTLILTLGRGTPLLQRVVSVEGSATYRRENTVKPIEPGLLMREGDTIETARGVVVIEQPGGRLELRNDSSLEFREEGRRLKLAKGTLDARGDNLTISSEWGAAQLRGALARVRVYGESMRVEVEEGSVAVEPDRKRSADSSGRMIDISAGQYVQFGYLEHASTGRHIGRAKVDAAVRRACAFLESRRSEIVAPIASEQRHAPAPRRTYAELALLALHRAGIPDSDPFKAELLGMVKGRSVESTYVAAMQAMALAEIDPVAHHERIRFCAQLLVDSQCANGQWDYAVTTLPGVPASGPIKRRREGPASGDNSVSSYAALGLFACAKNGVEIDHDVLVRAAQWWIKCQNSDGGWGYNDAADRLANDANRRTFTTNTSYGSATASGVAALIALQTARSSDRRIPEIRKGQSWLAANFGVDRNPGKDPGFVHLHWLVSAARAGELLRDERFGSHEWHADGTEFLLKAQQPTGGWTVEQGEFMAREKMDVLDTCLAILFLKREGR